MAITLELPPEVEAKLTTQARALGLNLDEYLESLLRDHAARGGGEHMMSAEEFEAELDGLTAHSAKIPVLPLEAMNREAIYQDHD